nr:hypothetical protein [Tanacetum cinerariifolium]
MTSSNNQMHNDIMAAGSKERPSMLAPDNRKLIDAEVELVHMILNGIGNDIYSTMDACSNAKEMWITIERLQQGEFINIQDVKTKLFCEFGKFTSRDGESIESYYTRFYRMMNEMVRNKLNVDTLQKKSKNIFKAPSLPSESVSEEDSNEEHAQKDKQIQKMLALIAKHFKKSTNLPTSELHQTLGTRMWILLQELGMTYKIRRFGHFAKECRSTKRVKDYEYHKEKMLLCMKEAKMIQLSAEQREWLHDTNDEPDEQELKAYYMYLAWISEVLHATDDNFGPTFDIELIEKVQSDDDYNVFATEKQHPEQPKSIIDTYLAKKVNINVTIDSLDMSTNERGVYQNAEKPEDERMLLLSLIANIKLDVDEQKNIQTQLQKANMSLSQELAQNK